MLLTIKPEGVLTTTYKVTAVPNVMGLIKNNTQDIHRLTCSCHLSPAHREQEEQCFTLKGLDFPPFN